MTSLWIISLSAGTDSFFTPQSICDMMAIIINLIGSGKTVEDCACGSGRMLLAAARISRMNSFYGADIDRTCCLMAVINLCLNGMIGKVALMDTLCNRFYGGWQIDIHPVHIVPFVREIHEAEKLHSASSAGSQIKGPDVARAGKSRS